MQIESSLYTPIPNMVRPFVLTPAGGETRPAQLWAFSGTVLIPFGITGVLIYYFAGLRESQWITVMLPVLLILLNLHFFLINRKTGSKKLTLWIDLDEIKLIRNGQLLHREIINKIQVKREDGVDQNGLPRALKLEGAQFPTVFILSPKNKKILNHQSAEKSVFCLRASKTEWERLLKNFRPY